VFGAYVAAALASVAYGLTRPPDPVSGGRLSGPGLNPNDLGSLLVAAIVLAVTLAATSDGRPIRRWFSLLAAAGCAAGLFLTESRGAVLLGFGSALLIAPFAAGRGRRAATTVWVALAVVLAAAWFVLAASPGSTHRLLHPGEAGGSGRSDLWRVAVRMADAHPVTGVGAGNFRVVESSYLLRPGTTQRDIYILDQPRVPHNIYLNVLAELGVVGLLLFVAILASALACALGAARAFARRRDRELELLSRGLFIALVGVLSAGFVSSGVYYKDVWLLVALAPALLGLARRA
jgi:O-antigen ligase